MHPSSPADTIAPILRQESDLKELRRLLKRYFPRVCSRDAEGLVRRVTDRDVQALLDWETLDHYDPIRQREV